MEWDVLALRREFEAQRAAAWTGQEEKGANRPRGRPSADLSMLGSSSPTLEVRSRRIGSLDSHDHVRLRERLRPLTRFPCIHQHLHWPATPLGAGNERCTHPVAKVCGPVARSTFAAQNGRNVSFPPRPAAEMRMHALNSDQDPDIPLSAIRDAVERRIRGSSLRRVAAEVELSPSGLTHFLEGAEPYRATFERLRLWFCAQPENVDTMSSGQARLALRMLVAGVPVERRATAYHLVLDTLTQAYGGSPPTWAMELRDDAGGSSPGT